jgi:enoyl-CoA hydratase
MSDTAPQSEAPPAELIVRIEGRAGRISLNRSRALNALSTGMCQGIIDALLGWRSDPQVAIVLIDHAGDRGFCAGGDIRAAAQSGAGDLTIARDFFRTEYRMNELMFRYQKPIAVFMDGITMGGGVGISMPGRYRIATERTVWAMPEGDIGFFPDVGEGWYLPRLPGHVGTWLGLTGARLKAADTMVLGIASHYIESSQLPIVKEGLLGLEDSIDMILAPFKAVPGPAPVNAIRDRIEKIYALPTVERIVDALGASTAPDARAERDALLKKCPMSLKVTLRLLHGCPRKFLDNMVEEYRIAMHMVQRNDFREGVRAILIDKDNKPVWQPAELTEVTEDMVDAMFDPLPGGEEWTPIG